MPIANIPLHDASAKGDLERVKHIVSTGAVDVNIRGLYGLTPLMLAAQNGHYDVFEYLHSNGADLTLVDRDGDHILSMACVGNNMDMVKYVVSKEPTLINKRRNDGRTALMWVAWHGKETVFRYLLDKGAECSLVDNDGHNTLHYACHGGHIGIVNYVIDRPTLNISNRDLRGRTALMIAATYGHKDVFELLVGKDSDISHTDKHGNTILHAACSGGDVEMVQHVLSQEDIYINCRGQNGGTPLMFAAFGGHREVFDLLVTKGADATLVCNKGNTILHVACIGGHVEMVEHIMSQGIGDVNSQNQDGRTPLLLAAFGGHREVFDLLVRNGANASVVCNMGNTILHVACIGGHVEMVEHIMSQGIGDVNSQNQDGRTPLLLAAFGGHREVFDLLVRNGANASVVCNMGNTILHVACIGGHVEMVEHIMSQGIGDVNSQNQDGRTPLLLAAFGGHREVFDLLVRNGANASVVCNMGNTILHVACIGGHVEMVEHIMSQGIGDVNSQNQDGRTPLLLAAFGGHREVFDLLVRNGANASVVCNKGNTILHVACIGGHVEMVEHIMSQGIGDVNSQNQDGRTPLLLAAFGGHREVFDLLVRNGANASVVCNKGNTILHVACIGGHVEMVEHIMSQGIGDVNSQNQDGRTPLMSAELQGCGETLLSPGVDLSQMNDKGNNVLHLACEIGSMEIVQHVVSQNSLDINAKNSKGETATRVAKRKHHMDLYEWLVSQGGHVVSKSYKH
ncbi:ankyrin repeat domain-containing protein 50-like [Haliotis rufescens]|uniref:ankyrin repeat domain-containing protein 50-like n=1 Tax=Haliotis rufescens TaxID=6454 RepID=UPI00201F97B8|nr:ankyrin repeat domain-containing protein 50-like [Haliotis rufescens]